MNETQKGRFNTLVQKLQEEGLTASELEELKILLPYIEPLKPKPLEGWAVKFGYAETILYPTETAARHAARQVSGTGPSNIVNVVHMREVT